MKKVFLHMICLVVILFSQQTTFAKTPTGYSVPAFLQEQSNWCWAACGRMIYWAYHKGDISQCLFVARSRDRENSTSSHCNNLPSSGNPCTNRASFNKSQSLYICGGGSTKDVLGSFGISSTAFGRAISASELSSAMAAKKMCLARWRWNAGGGHVVVINRFKSGNVYYNDPLHGAKTLSYNHFLTANGEGTWTHTLRIDNAPVFGDPLYRMAE